MLFVRGCLTLCSRIISLKKAHEAHQCFSQFLRLHESLYGVDNCTINMHLHLHLEDCIRDYGPVYSFWCFAFECLNGILGDYHTNNKYIESQMMDKFLQQQQSLLQKLPSEFAYLFADLHSRHRDTAHPNVCWLWGMQSSKAPYYLVWFKHIALDLIVQQLTFIALVSF